MPVGHISRCFNWRFWMWVITIVAYIVRSLNVVVINQLQILIIFTTQIHLSA